MNRSMVRVPNKLALYQPTSYKMHVMTPRQAKEFERRQAEPPRQPTEAEREAVRMFNQTVKR